MSPLIQFCTVGCYLLEIGGTIGLNVAVLHANYCFKRGDEALMLNGLQLPNEFGW
jgi:hypothetical protein